MAEATAAVPTAVTAPENKPKLADLDPTKTEVRVGLQHAAGMEKNAKHPLTEQQKAVFDRGKAQLDAKKAGESLQTLRSGFTRSEWQKTVKDRIFTGPEDSSGNKTGNAAEMTEAARLEKFIKTAETYTQKGFDKLSPGEQTAMTVALKDIIDNNPVLADALAFRVDPTTGKPSVTDATVQNLLKQEGFKAQVADLLDDKLNPESSDKEKELGNSIATNRNKLDAARSTKAAKEAEKTKIEGAPAARKAFDTDVDATTGKTKAEAMRELQGGLDTTASGDANIDMGMHGLKNNLDGLDTVVKQLATTPKDAAGYPDLVAKQAELQRWVNEAKSFPPPYGEQATQYTQLYTESQEINSNLSRTGELPQLNTDIAAADKTVADAARELTKLQAGREGMSGEFAKGVDDVMKQATEQYMQQKVLEYVQAYRVVGETAPSELTTKYADALQKTLNERWQEKYMGGMLGRTEKTRINKEQAEADMASLATDGPDGIIMNALKNAGVPEGEISLMIQNKAFMDVQRAEVTGKALAAFVGAGGKLREQQIHVLALTSYGQEAMQNMIDTNQNAKDVIAKMKKAGLVNTGSLSEIHEKFGGKGILWLLAGAVLTGITAAARDDSFSTVMS